MIYLITLIAVAALILAMALAALWLHKRAASRNVSLIGRTGKVETALDPNGSVLIRGEIWRARSVDGSLVASPTAVRVVGLDNLYLLVESL